MGREGEREMSLCPRLTSSQGELCGRPAGCVQMPGAVSSLPLTFLSQQLHVPSLVCPIALLVAQAKSPQGETGCDHSPRTMFSSLL